MTAIQEINFYNNFDLLSQTLKDHDPQVVQALNEIAIYVAGLHIENRDNLTFINSFNGTAFNFLRNLIDGIFEKCTIAYNSVRPISAKC